jgi:hypothetical protein
MLLRVGAYFSCRLSLALAVLQALQAAVRAKMQYPCVFATCGLAAGLYFDGKTAHRAYGLPVPCDTKSCSGIGARTDRANLLRLTALHIIDEAVMLNWLNFNLIDT